VTGIASGKTWSRIGPEVAPTDSAASGVWTLQELAENQGAGTWPQPKQSSFEWLAGFAPNGTNYTYTFSNIPQTYGALKMIVSMPGIASGAYPQPFIRVNGATDTYWNMMYNYSPGGTLWGGGSAIDQNRFRALNGGGNTVSSNPYILEYDFQSYSKTNLCSPIQLIWGATTGSSSTTLSSQQQALYRNGTPAYTSITIETEPSQSTNFRAGTTINLFGEAIS
jgi:hypothetical protein